MDEGCCWGVPAAAPTSGISRVSPSMRLEMCLAPLLFLLGLLLVCCRYSEERIPSLPAHGLRDRCSDVCRRPKEERDLGTDGKRFLGEAPSLSLSCPVLQRKRQSSRVACTCYLRRQR